MPAWLQDPALLWALAASYLLGAIPFGWLLVKLVRGSDLRRFGSGNIGATNAGRALGKWAAVLVYLLDGAKGWLPAAAFADLFRLQTEGAWQPSLIGAAAVAGHCFPVYLGFRGGKGVATTTGVMAALDPLALGLAAGVWIVTLVFTRYVSVASILLALSLPGFVYFGAPGGAPAEKIPVLLLAAAIALFILFTHRENIRRLANGTEPRIGIPWKSE